MEQLRALDLNTIDRHVSEDSCVVAIYKLTSVFSPPGATMECYSNNSNDSRPRWTQQQPFLAPAVPLQVKPLDVRWYTRVRDHTDIHVTGAHVAYPTAHAALAAIAARRAAAGTDTRQSTVKLEPAAATACPVHGVEAAQQQVKAEEGGGAAAVAGKLGVSGLLNGSAAEQQRCQVYIKSEDGAEPASAAAGAAGSAANAAQCCCCCAGSLTIPPTTTPEPAAAAAATVGTSGSDSGRQHAVAGVTSAVCESCVITVRFMGYFRVHQGSGQVFDAIDLFLPDTQFETQVS
jgi:hypothetical protein